jgi:uncharacterized membrane protein
MLPVDQIWSGVLEDRQMNKTMSFAVVHFTVAFTVAYLMSGSLLVGGSIALVEPVVNTIAYHFHEQVWNRVKNARVPAPNQLVSQV